MIRRYLTVAAVLTGLFFLVGCNVKSEKQYFKAADDYVVRGEFNKAVQTYHDYLREFPKGKNRDRAMFNIGSILYYALDKKAEGAAMLGRLVNQYPAGAFSYKSRIILAGAFCNEAKDYKRAIIEYKWLLKQNPNHPKAPDFQFQIIKCYTLSQDLEQTVLELGRFIENYPDSPLIEQAYNELGSTHLILNRPEQAIYIFNTLLNLFPESRNANSVRFKIGTAYEDLNKNRAALKMYEFILDKYENRPAVETRIRGIKQRMKKKLTDVKPVDYNYRPEKDDETTKNLEDDKSKNGKKSIVDKQ